MPLFSARMVLHESDISRVVGALAYQEKNFNLVVMKSTVAKHI